MMRSIVIWLVLFAVLPSASLAQTTWEVTPYKVKVWFMVDEAPELPDGWKSRLASTMQSQLRPMFAGVIDTTVGPAPSNLRLWMKRDSNSLTRERLFESHPELVKIDKLFLVAIEANRQAYSIQVREVDCLLTHVGPVSRQTVGLLEQVVPGAAEMIGDSFSPVVRIERAEKGMVRTHVRAGALLQSPLSPGAVRSGDLMLPYDNRVKNGGRFSLKNIRPVDWTYLQVPTDVATQGIRKLEIVSGFRQPFRSKRSRRLQQFAIRVRPPSNQTTIRLLSRAEKEPLIGYEIHEKGDEVTNFIGYTDWKGELLVPPSDKKVRMLLVRSGGRVLAKLPIMPGLREEVDAYIRDDRLRVAADGFLSGVQMGIVDLVAKRESLSTRIRNRIEANDFKKAAELLEQFRKLPTQGDFRREVELQLQSLKLDDSGADSKLRTQITTTFVQTIGTLGKYLDPKRVRELEAELVAAQRSSS